MSKLQVLAGLFGSGAVAVFSFLAGLSSVLESIDVPADQPSSSVNDYSPAAPSTTEQDLFDTSNPDSPWYDDGGSAGESLCSTGAFSC